MIIKFYFEIKGISRISYLDIGANHPWKFNNTAFFYLEGSSGVNIEPDPDLFNTLRKQRRRDVNLNAAIDSREREIELFLFQEHTMNTLDASEADKNAKERGFHPRPSVKVRTMTLNGVINTYFNGSFPDFLSIDAEGMDEHIITSMDVSRTLPKVVCIETISYTPDLTGTKNDSIIAFLKDLRYKVFADTYVNTIFVRNP